VVLVNSPLIFGEVLFDSFPDGREVLGGAPFNVAWNLQALGLSPLLITRTGNDKLGRQIRETMEYWEMDCRGLQVDRKYPTGKVHIKLVKGEPSFKIPPNQAYDYISGNDTNLHFEPSFIYHGSLALRNEVSYNYLTLLKQRHMCPVFVDINLRSPWWSPERVFSLIEGATWLKLNDAELDALFPSSQNLEERCRVILESFDLEAVFVTLGDKGAAAFYSDRGFSFLKPKENVSITDTVGAGDAFSTVLLLGLTIGWPAATTMQRAQELASAVVGIRGAVSHDRVFYDTIKNKWKL
jgi:fructokinase